MKSFKQYLLEAPEMALHGGRPDYLSRLVPSVPGELIGKIGSYSLIRPHKEHPLYPDAFDKVYHLVHKEQIVGIFPVQRLLGGRATIFNPVIHKTHAGKNAKVKDLVPKVYGTLADKLKLTIESGDEQTRGSRSVWRRLAGIRPVHMEYDGKVTVYKPATDEKRAYSRRSNPDGYSYSELTRFELRPKKLGTRRK